MIEKMIKGLHPTMTEYKEAVDKQKERIAHEKWSNTIEMIYAANGVTETHLRDGSIQYLKDGKTWTKKSELTYEAQIAKMNRFVEKRSRNSHSYRVNSDGRLEDVIITEDP
tara:strand:+ start:44 stop:376 length:333 start_codon:yes stop_codon:yes gene_type:complete